MNRAWFGGLAVLLIAASGAGTLLAQDEPRDASNSRRMVLIALYTSPGCHMCPTAEYVLGAVAEPDRAIVSIAFHVDSFSEPWKKAFSDPLCSKRLMACNQPYTKPTSPEYGLSYTSMMMVGGE